MSDDQTTRILAMCDQVLAGIRGYRPPPEQYHGTEMAMLDPVSFKHIGMFRRPSAAHLEKYKAQVIVPAASYQHLLKSFFIMSKSITLYDLKPMVKEWIKSNRAGRTKVDATVNGAIISFMKEIDATLFVMEWKSFDPKTRKPG